MKKFHSDQQALYDILLVFTADSVGVEVTEEDLLEAFRAAKEENQYFTGRNYYGT